MPSLWSQWTSFCGAMDLMSKVPGVYQDEITSLREHVCKAAGMPDDVEHAQEALQKLRKDDAEHLRLLLRHYGGFNTQVTCFLLLSFTSKGLEQLKSTL